MRNRTIILLFIIFSFSVNSAESGGIIKPVEWGTDVNNTIRLIKLTYGIMAVETNSYDTLKVREQTNAAGWLQITPIAVREANRIIKNNKYTLSDRFKARESLEIFYIIQRYHNSIFNINAGCFLWVSGHITSNNSYAKYYVNKVNAAINKTNK